VKHLTYISVAETELTEAAEYYNAQQSGLGKIFLDAVREAETHIRRYPERWAFYRNPIRSYRVSPFPYRILYRELGDRIQIVAVAHLSRRPGYWKGRLG
jgi:hypothetical protein